MLQQLVVITSVLLLTFPAQGPSPRDSSPDRLPPVVPNDNTRAAGVNSNGTVSIRLRAAAGLWRPDGERGGALQVEAFGEEGGPLGSPGPLVRVPEGTTIHVSVRNDLGDPLRVHGFCTRDGSPCPPIEVPPGASREVHFTAGRAGTYHYWGTTTSMPLSLRAVGDTQLSGAFVVDPPGADPAADRVLVITDWTNLTRAQLAQLAQAEDTTVAFFGMNPRFGTAINGLSWPATERLTYKVGEQVRWRVLNLSTRRHPMHLHGFYFTVDAVGDGLEDTVFEEGRRVRVVTHLIPPGSTLAMTWVPERPGNWLFHCHIAEHVSSERRVAPSPEDHAAHGGQHGGGQMNSDMTAGMAGMVVGVTITGDDRTPPEHGPVRRITLTMERDRGGPGGSQRLGFSLSGEKEVPQRLSVPGPTLVLQRGQPVEITLKNTLGEATAIHWHGMELDSYFDGVHGWSGAGTRITPIVAPGGTFVVRFAPPRTGTFIYHTHLHGGRQLTAGMYGAMIVVERGETFDPSVDHVLVIGRSGPDWQDPILMNGGREPAMVLKAGVKHRFRFINITPDETIVASFVRGDTPVEWTPVTKDGAPVPTVTSVRRSAVQTISVGETYDFEFDAPQGRHALWFNLRSPAGKWMLQARVVVK